jgi:uncharacterized membrane protein YozB (DUF420 family)
LRALFLATMAVGAAWITASSVVYFDFDELPPFVIEKLPLRFEALWLAALRVHVAAALLAFPLCILLMIRAVQRRAVVHRWLGRTAAMIVLLALVPSGVVLAFAAKGGPSVTAGFLLTGTLIAWFIAKGVLAARRRELALHRRAMLHVFAQMSVAVTSRCLLVGLDAAGMAPDVAYVVALWVPVLGSAAAAEWVCGSSRFNANVPRGMRHVFSKMVTVLRAGAGAVSRPVARVGR